MTPFLLSLDVAGWDLGTLTLIPTCVFAYRYPDGCMEVYEVCDINRYLSR
jgi:hypothetical protein